MRVYFKAWVDVDELEALDYVTRRDTLSDEEYEEYELTEEDYYECAEEMFVKDEFTYEMTFAEG